MPKYLSPKAYPAILPCPWSGLLLQMCKPHYQISAAN